MLALPSIPTVAPGIPAGSGAAEPPPGVTEDGFVKVTVTDPLAPAFATIPDPALVIVRLCVTGAEATPRAETAVSVTT